MDPIRRKDTSSFVAKGRVTAPEGLPGVPNQDS